MGGCWDDEVWAWYAGKVDSKRRRWWVWRVDGCGWFLVVVRRGVMVDGAGARAMAGVLWCRIGRRGGAGGSS